MVSIYPFKSQEKSSATLIIERTGISYPYRSNRNVLNKSNSLT